MIGTLQVFLFTRRQSRWRDLSLLLFCQCWLSRPVSFNEVKTSIYMQLVDSDQCWPRQHSLIVNVCTLLTLTFVCMVNKYACCSVSSVTSRILHICYNNNLQLACISKIIILSSERIPPINYAYISWNNLDQHNHVFLNMHEFLSLSTIRNVQFTIVKWYLTIFRNYWNISKIIKPFSNPHLSQ